MTNQTAPSTAPAPADAAAQEPITWGPMVAGESAADRLMRALDYRLSPDVEPLSTGQVAVVLHALADHTALMAALEYRHDPTSPWPSATSVGRWMHGVGDQLDHQHRTAQRNT